MDPQLSTALQGAFPGRKVTEVEGTGPSWNDQNRTVRLTFTDGDTTYLKFATDGNGTRIARERAVITYVGANREILVPTIVTADPAHDVPYLATAPVPCETLLGRWSDAAEDERADLIAAVGQTLAALHAERFPEHGAIVGGDETGLTLDTGTWTDVLISQIKQMQEIAPTKRFPEHFDAVIDAVEENRDLLDGTPAALLHGDPAHPNGFLVDDRIGFLDWEIAHVGDPVRELHRAQRQLLDSQYFDVADRLNLVFLDAYREAAGELPAGYEERRDIYELVGYLGRSGFFSKWAPDSERPEEELAETVETEMQRRLEAVQ
ncbi:MAG: phosphotransferase family protein [Halolamina sp.]